LFTISGQKNVDFTTDASALAAAVGDIHLDARRNTAGAECPTLSPYEAYAIANQVSLEVFNAKIKEMAGCQNKGPAPDVPGWDARPQPQRGVNPTAVQTTVELGSAVRSLANLRWEQVVSWSRTNRVVIGNVVDALGRLPGSRTILLSMPRGCSPRRPRRRRARVGIWMCDL
jgi:hypothetical protein